jgi:hypothetical protein
MIRGGQYGNTQYPIFTVLRRSIAAGGQQRLGRPLAPVLPGKPNAKGTGPRVRDEESDGPAWVWLGRLMGWRGTETHAVVAGAVAIYCCVRQHRATVAPLSSPGDLPAPPLPAPPPATPAVETGCDLPQPPDGQPYTYVVCGGVGELHRGVPYSETGDAALAPGALVWVSQKKSQSADSCGELFSRATVVADPLLGGSESSAAQRRVTIRYPKGSTYRVRRRLLAPVLPPSR